MNITCEEVFESNTELVSCTCCGCGEQHHIDHDEAAEWHNLENFMCWECEKKKKGIIIMDIVVKQSEDGKWEGKLLVDGRIFCMAFGKDSEEEVHESLNLDWIRLR